MATTVNAPEPLRAKTTTEPTSATTSRLRTVTGDRFPRKYARGRSFQIPDVPIVRSIVDFDAPKPNP